MVNLFVEPISPIFACCDSLITAADVASASRFQCDKRRKEHLSWRRIVRRELGRGVVIDYNDVGAPVVDTLDTYISVAHAKEQMVAVAIADERVGVDVESLERDFGRAASRYMSDDEMRLSDNGWWYAMVWSAKEAMYKLYGRRGVDMRDELRVISYDDAASRAVGMLGDNSVVIDIKIVNGSFVVAVATYE